MTALDTPPNSVLLGNSAVAAIQSWPDPFVDALRARLLAVHSRSALATEDLAELKAHGLIDPVTARPTALGDSLTDLLIREEWQEYDEFATLTQGYFHKLVNASVLEIGCSTGGRLRKLAIPSLARCVGVDIDAVAVALGNRLARNKNQPVHLTHCSAHSLPFPAEAFDLVICRNALTYMHQRTALDEVGRVLKPGGLFFLRFENVRYDLRRLLSSRKLKLFLTGARTCFLGFVLATLGWQAKPGGRLIGERAFASLRQLRKMLRTKNCEVVKVGAARNCPQFLGASTQTSLLAAKYS